MVTKQLRLHLHGKPVCDVPTCDYPAEVFGIRNWRLGWVEGQPGLDRCGAHAPSLPRRDRLIEPLDHDYDIIGYERRLTPIGSIDVPEYAHIGKAGFPQELA